ncbi:MAG: hypothetical protein WCI00_05605 [bacterium]
MGICKTREDGNREDGNRVNDTPREEVHESFDNEDIQRVDS